MDCQYPVHSNSSGIPVVCQSPGILVGCQYPVGCSLKLTWYTSGLSVTWCTGGLSVPCRGFTQTHLVYWWAVSTLYSVHSNSSGIPVGCQFPVVCSLKLTRYTGGLSVPCSGMVVCCHRMVSLGQSTTWQSPSLSRSNTWPLSSWNPSAHLALVFVL